MFPKVALDAYLSPSTSSSTDVHAGWPGFGNGEKSIRRGKGRNGGRGDLEGLAIACEKYFEWGTKDIVVKKFAGESVGVYGSQVMNEARETMRRRTRASRSRSPSRLPVDASSSQGSSSRITSFFPEVRPGPSSSKNTSSRKAPEHVIQIHGTREDPTDVAQIEYRVSFEHAPYSSRTRSAMSGHRIDPKDLDMAMRKELGLVEKDTITNPGDELKQEQRVWIADYLVQAAWPDLVDAYDAELRRKDEAKKRKEAKAKTASKTGAPSTAMTNGPSKKKAPTTSGAQGMDTRAFDAFFTQKTAPKAAKPISTSRSSKSSPLLDSDSDIEVVEMVEDDTPRRKVLATRHHPTSSLSSVASDSLSPPPATIPGRRSTRSAGVQKASLRAVRAPTRNTRSTSKAPIEVINLCSSEDETPKANRIASILGPTTENLPRSPGIPHRTRRSPKKKSKALPDSPAPPTSSQSTQTRLEMPVLGPSSQRAKVATPKSVKRASPRKKQEPDAYYMVLSETDDEVDIDITGKGTMGTTYY